MKPTGRTARRSLVGLGVVLLALIALLTPRTPPPHAPPPVRAVSFDAWRAREDARAAAEGVPPDHRLRVVRRTADRSDVAILYIHGFGAARQEGEAVVDAAAEALAANVVYMRLPGHGGGAEAHARARATDYLDGVEEAAAPRPADVQALVMANPLFGFRSRLSFLGGTLTGQAIIRLLEGTERDASFSRDPERRKQPGYDEHWITRQRWEAFFNLHEVVRRCAGEDTLARVQAPVLLLWSRRDQVVDVEAMHRALRSMGSTHKKDVEIADGNHILLSQYVRTDKPAAGSAIVSFLREAGLAGRPTTRAP